MRSPLLVRKRRVSVTRMGAKQSYPSNHGTHPKAYHNRTFARSFPSAMATAAASPPPSATQRRYKSSHPSVPPFTKTTPPVTTQTAAAADNVSETPEKDVIDPDEPWILDLKEEMERELATKAATVYKELLQTLADAGPFIDHDKANALQANYQKELDQMRQAHQKEVDQLVHMERQYRLWSMGAEDPEWEIWDDLREEQLCILKGIQKMAGLNLDEEDPPDNDEEGTANDEEPDEVERQVRETAQETEQANRSYAEWQRTEAQRMRDRAQWREGMMESQSKVKERRRQDTLDFEAQFKAQQDWNERTEQLATEARQGSAALRGQPSLATLFANGEPFVTWKPGPSSASDTQSRASFADSWSSDASFTTSDTTPASSIYFNPLDSPPPRYSNARPIPVHPPDERNRFSSGSGYYSGSGFEERQRTPYGSFSNSTRMHGAGHTPSPTPPSNMPSSNPSHSKSGITEAIPERWIPPGHQPREKPSMHFDNKTAKETGGPVRSKSTLFGESPAPPHPPIPVEEMSKSAGSSETHHPQRSSTLNSGTTADHHTTTPPPRSASYSYSFSSSASATPAGGMPSGVVPPSAASAPPTSTSTSNSTSRVPLSSYQAPPAPGLRSKPLPQHPSHSIPTSPLGPNSASSSSSSSTTKPSYPSTHTHIPPQRHHSFATQASPTEPKTFHPQTTNRSFSASGSSSFSASIPAFSTRTSSASASASAAVPPTSPVDDPLASRASATATSSSIPQSASQIKNATSSAHSATHATQTPFNKASSSQTHTQPPPPPPQSVQPQNPFSSTEEFRTKLRDQYVADEERRAEEERVRRLEEEHRKQEQQEEERRQKEQEANERRAEEAKRRGEERRRDEERRRQEEMARDAERREQERKARKAAAAAAAASGTSGSYPGAGFAFSGGSYSTSGSSGSSMPGAGHGSSSSASGSYSSAGASVTSPPTPPPSSTPSVPEIWDAHEKQWAAMAKVPNLRFRSMPWPVLAPISNPEQLLPIRIAQFIFHAQHSHGKSKEKRLREALLKWHPDRFDSKWLPKVVPEDREKVADGAGRVVRALNELLNGVHSNGFGE